mmetsp:Transcript_15523/g.38665  ORF Transcript_15523/g.38665 Transcript_15523/m.38665 type:complete len:235 (-) Transcript_15523:581-1285(-)
MSEKTRTPTRISSCDAPECFILSRNDWSIGLSSHCCTASYISSWIDDDESSDGVSSFVPLPPSPPVVMISDSPSLGLASLMLLAVLVALLLLLLFLGLSSSSSSAETVRRGGSKSLESPPAAEAVVVLLVLPLLVVVPVGFCCSFFRARMASNRCFRALLASITCLASSWDIDSVIGDDEDINIEASATTLEDDDDAKDDPLELFGPSGAAIAPAAVVALATSMLARSGLLLIY